MYIKIFNKNTTHPDSSQGNFEIDEGSVFTENKNETLDSGTVIISNLSEPLSIEPYDIVHIPYLQKYMCVDTYVETLTCISPKVYKYEISLSSETKQLEGIILPNLKITKVWSEDRTVFDYIDDYLKTYCPKVRVGTSSSWDYDYKWSWNTQANRSKFNMQCPEMQWNTPTLREVLNDLMMVADCIPVIREGQIQYMDLTEINIHQGNPVDWEGNQYVNYVTKSRSSEDYVSELQMDLLNVTNQLENVNNVVTKAEWIMFSPAEDDVVLQNKNMVLRTSYPIYNIKSLYIYFIAGFVIGDDGDTQWIRQDITDIVSEYQKWITKPVLYNIDSPSFTQFKNSQNWSVYYVRNSNEIKNWNHTTKYWWQTRFLYEELMDKIVRYQHPDVNVGSSVTLKPWYSIFFKIEYETLAGCLFRASKGYDVEHERVIIDNQTNSMVDSYNQGKLEYQKANRLGNEQLQINARIPKASSLIYTGDVYGDSIIYQVQYQFYREHIDVNALATKDYVLREYFTGVKSKIRSWQIADESQSCKRHDLSKYYCEFSFNTYEDKDLDSFEDYNVSRYFLSPIYNSGQNPIKYVFVQTKATQSDSNVWYPSSSRYYALDLISRLVGDSIVFTYEFPDNFWACQILDTNRVTYSDITGDGYINNGLLGTGDDKGFPLKMMQYTNDIGELDNSYAIFSENIINSPYSGDMEPGESVVSSVDKSKDFLYNLWQMPEVGTANISDDRFASILKIHKDSQERISVSTQFEFCTETRDICFSKEWIKRQDAIQTFSTGHIFYQILCYNKSKYDFKNPDKLPLGNTEYSFSVNIDVSTIDDQSNTSSKLVFKLSQTFPSSSAARIFANTLATNYCFYLYDGNPSNEKVLLAFNNLPVDEAHCGYWEETTYEGIVYHPTVSIYMNVLKTRSKNIYDEDNHYLIVDKI